MAKMLSILVMSLALLNIATSCSAKENGTEKTNKKSEPIQKTNNERTKANDEQADKKEVQKKQQDSEAAETKKAEDEQTKPVKAEKAEEKQSTAKQRKAEPKWLVSFYKKYAKLLEEFVNDKGMVNYDKLRLNRSDLRRLWDELAELDTNEYKTWTKEDKIAFWANTYNIQMLKIITDNYPIKPASRIHLLWWPPTSIRHIKGIRSDYKFIVMDEEFTLASLENRFFRKEFNEPRVFFAICNATVSDPRLLNKPYRRKNLYKQLDSRVKEFLSRPDALRIEKHEERVLLSTIFESNWYGKEFIKKYGIDRKFKDHNPEERAALNFISNYIPEQDVHYLETANYAVKHIGYDWRLNKQ